MIARKKALLTLYHFSSPTSTGAGLTEFFQAHSAEFRLRFQRILTAITGDSRRSLTPSECHNTLRRKIFPFLRDSFHSFGSVRSSWSHVPSALASLLSANEAFSGKPPLKYSLRHCLSWHIYLFPYHSTLRPAKSSPMSKKGDIISGRVPSHSLASPVFRRSFFTGTHSLPSVIPYCRSFFIVARPFLRWNS